MFKFIIWLIILQTNFVDFFSKSKFNHWFCNHLSHYPFHFCNLLIFMEILKLYLLKPCYGKMNFWTKTRGLWKMKNAIFMNYWFSWRFETILAEVFYGKTEFLDENTWFVKNEKRDVYEVLIFIKILKLYLLKPFVEKLDFWTKTRGLWKLKNAIFFWNQGYCNATYLQYY